MRAPFPYFGGKYTIASIVWQRFGNPVVYAEPFCGSAAVLLARPENDLDASPRRIENINDADGMVANFWRAAKRYPDLVARYADWPVNEADLHARHLWLTTRRPSLTARLEADPDWCDPRAAGYWVWGMSIWIGGSFCGGHGPWGARYKRLMRTSRGRMTRKRPHLTCSRGIVRQRPAMSRDNGMVKRSRPHLGDAGRGIVRPTARPYEVMAALAERLRYVRVACGNWDRILGRGVTTAIGPTAVFLDPPYNTDMRNKDLYASDQDNIAKKVRQWCLEHGDDSRLRIAMCGYEGEHDMPADWECVAWKAQGGMAHVGRNRGKRNRFRERIWFSPSCREEVNATCTMF